MRPHREFGSSDRAARISPVRSGSFEIREQFLGNMVIDFNRVTCRVIKPCMPRTHFTFDARAEVSRSVQISGDLQCGDASLMVGQPPNAAERLKQADEIQIGNLAMQHFEPERRTFGHLPIDDRPVEKRECAMKSGGPDDGVECL